MKVGFYEKDITPPLGSMITGYFNPRYATGIKEKLCAKSMVIESEGTLFSYTAVDVCNIPPDAMRDIIKGISEKTGISSDHVLVSATHCHTGSLLIRPTKENNKPGMDSSEYRIGQVIESAVYAYQHLQEANCRYGYGENSHFAFVRNFLLKDGRYITNPPRLDPNIDHAIGEIDPSVNVLYFEDLSGNPLGALTNYACHCDVVSGNEFSGDFPAIMAKELKKTFGPEFVSVYMQGACGNVNDSDVSVPAIDSVQWYQEAGKSLAETVTSIIKSSEKMTDTNISALREEIILKVRKLPEGMLEEARHALIDIPASEERVYDFNDYSNPLVVRSYASRLVNIYDNLATVDPRGIVTSVQAIKFGDCYFYGVPGELFNQYAFYIKEKAPTKRTFIAELSQPGYNNYIAIPLFYESDDVYEGKVSSCWIEKGEGQRIAEKAVEVGQKLQ